MMYLAGLQYFVINASPTELDTDQAHVCDKPYYMH